MIGTRYSKAPIAEAVIDIQVRYSEPLSPSALSEFGQSVKSQLPLSDAIRALEVGLASLGQDNISSTFGQRNVGSRLTDESNSRVLQVRDVGFTYSHLPPYTEWGRFRREAELLWSEFVKICKPQIVTRCAVRYINKIVMPMPKFDAQRFFNIYPTVPVGIPQDIAGLFMQLQMPQTDLDDKSAAVINIAFDSSTSVEAPTIILDFDIFKIEEIEPMSGDVWKTLERFRTRKNELFEACITEETRELIR